MASNAKNLAELLNQDTTVKVADIEDGSVTTAKLAADAVTAAKLADNSVVTANVSDGAITQAKTTGVGAGKNVIINGGMQIAQRETGTATGLGASSGYFCQDRWKLYASGTSGRISMANSTDTPEGFSKSMKLSCTTADTSIGTNESMQLQQLIEAQNMMHFKKGTSNALPFALSFYVKGNAAATYVAELEDYDNSSRHVGKAFNVTTSWNRVSIIFPADTTGVLNNDTGTGIALNIHLTAGSSNTSGTLRETWGTLSQANRVGSGTTSFLDSTSRTLYITGVKLETTQVTDFIHNTFHEDMHQCRRYYYHVYYSSPAQNAGYNNSYGTRMAIGPMRALPSVGHNGKTAYPGGVSNNSSMVPEPTVRSLNQVSIRWQFTGNNGYNYFDVDMTADAEL